MTAFRALLQSWHDGGVVERALLALEVAALRTIDEFEAQMSATSCTSWPKVVTAHGTGLLFLS